MLRVVSNEASVAPTGSTLPMLIDASTIAAEAGGSVEVGTGNDEQFPRSRKRLSPFRRGDVRSEDRSCAKGDSNPHGVTH
jgi:hypothetical protein